MNKINLNVQCPKCAENILATAEIPDTHNTGTYQENYPQVRGGIEPSSRILEYRITSEDLKKFIIDKAREYVPDVCMEIVPRYCEKKRKGKFEEHRSYASLRIAFSDNIVKHHGKLGWFDTIGENNDNINFHEGILNGLINRYKYNYKTIDAWLKSYDTLEQLENAFGMTESYINDLRMYAIPRRIKDHNEQRDWFVFSAAAENVIVDFLTDKNTNKVPGRIKIEDIYPISKDIVQFIVHVYPEQKQVKDNPHVRQILLGEEKPKK